MTRKADIPNKLELLTEIRDYYRRIIEIISDIQGGYSETQACRCHSMSVSDFRESTINRRKFRQEATSEKTFELYKEPAWAIYEDIFCEKLTLKSLSKLPIDLESTISAVVNEVLTNKQYDAMEAIYVEQLSYAEAGEKLGVTDKAVRNLVAKALSILRKPVNSKRIFYGDKFLAELADSQTQHLKNLMAKNNLEKYEKSIKISDTYMDVDISHLSLTTRAENCLRRANLTTIRKVDEMIESGRLWQVRNLGAKSINEVILATNRYIAQEQGKQFEVSIAE